MEHRTWIEISREALEKNVGLCRGLTAPNVSILAVVKGNAYGAGIEATVSATHKLVDWYGVDNLKEAEAVRKLCDNPILILSGISVSEARQAVEQGFSVNVYTSEVASVLSRHATIDNPAKIHIEVDTGLTRLGLLPDDAIDFTKEVALLPNVDIQGVYTHFARVIDDQNNKVYVPAIVEFNRVVESLNNFGIYPSILHTASSFASVLYKDTHLNMIRVGVTLYGIWGYDKSISFIQNQNINFPISPVITWKTSVINIKKVSCGQGIGYGHSEKVSRNSLIAVLGAGYYDGIDKRYGKVGHVLIRGQRAKILGSIAMNTCMVDVTDIAESNIGDTVTLIGRDGTEEITAYEFALKIQTSTYELMCRINPQLPRYLV